MTDKRNTVTTPGSKMKTTAIEKSLQPIDPTPRQMIATVVTDLREAGENAPAMVEALDRLMSMHERQEDRQAKRDFNAAIARFQKVRPKIIKNKTATKGTEGGHGKKLFDYADPEHLCEQIKPALDECGLAYRFSNPSEGVPDGWVKSVCTLLHRGGHSEDTEHMAPLDDRDNRMISATQKRAATRTNTNMKALCGALGITLADPGELTLSGAKLAGEQLKIIEELYGQVNGKKAFMEFMRVGSIEEIPTEHYDKARNALNAILEQEAKR